MTGGFNKPVHNAQEDLALEQMNLDQKEDFEGDAFDPFSMGSQPKVNVTLKKQKAHYKGGVMGVTEI